jgi:maltose alpha-D-glucosyltransferase/alpha-amylase
VVPAGVAVEAYERDDVTTELDPRQVEMMLAAAVERLPRLLPGQRWFGGKEHPITYVEVRDSAALPDYPSALLVLMDVHSTGQPVATYFLPLELAPDSAPTASVDTVVRADGLVLRDGLADPAACRALLRGIAEGRTAPTTNGGRFAFQATVSRSGAARLSDLDLDGLDVRRLTVEQSNSSVIFGRELILKAFRRTQQGANPEVEILRFLDEHTAFERVPRLLGWAEYQAEDGSSMPVGVLQAFVPNEGDGWAYVLGMAAAGMPGSSDASLMSRLTAALADLGTTLAELHLALASQPDVADFAPEALTVTDVAIWRDRTLGSLTRACRYVDDLVAGESAAAASLKAEAEAVQSGVSVLRATIDDFALLADGSTAKTRHHGDFHLGQTLVGPGGWTIIDFEGEPLRPLTERRAKQTPLRDVAGLLRSLDYAEATARRQRPASDTTRSTPEADRLLASAFAEARRAFLSRYVDVVRSAGAPLLPQRDDDLARVLHPLEVEKALYELSYEVGNRPDWVAIPLGALARLASAR